MRIDKLEIFCQVVEEGNISKVAKKNFITQPAITKQIRQLENIYDTELFERINGNLIVTDTGKLLYDLAKKIVFEYYQSFQIINEAKGKEYTSLKLGASYTIGEYYLPPSLGEFKSMHSDVDITLEVSSTPNILASLKENQIGIALVEGFVDDESLDVRKFFEDELVLVCSPKHDILGNRQTVKIEDLVNEKFIWREEKSGTRLLVENRMKENNALENINIYMELGSTQAIKGAVEINLGIAILSELVVESELKNGSLKKMNIENIQLKRDLWIVHNKKRYVNTIEKKFMNFLLGK